MLMDGTERAVWVRAAILSILAGLIAAGCKQVEVIPKPGHRLDAIVERWHPPCWSASTTALLSHLGLDDLAHHNPHAAFAEMEQGIRDGAPRSRTAAGPGGAGRPERPGDGSIRDR